MGNSIDSMASACLPVPVVRAMGLPTKDEQLHMRFEAARNKLQQGVHLLHERERIMDDQLRGISREIHDKAARGDRAGALSALKSKQSTERSRDKTRMARTRLEQQIESLIQNRFNGELHTVLEECSRVMKETLQGTSVTKVEDTVDTLAETHQDTKRIEEALTRPLDQSDAEDADYDEQDLQFAEIHPEIAASLDKISPGLGTGDYGIKPAKSKLEAQLDEFLETTSPPDENREAEPPRMPAKAAPSPMPVHARPLEYGSRRHPLRGATTVVLRGGGGGGGGHLGQMPRGPLSQMPRVPRDPLFSSQRRPPSSPMRYQPLRGPPSPVIYKSQRQPPRQRALLALDSIG